MAQKEDCIHKENAAAAGIGSVMTSMAGAASGASVAAARAAAESSASTSSSGSATAAAEEKKTRKNLNDYVDSFTASLDVATNSMNSVSGSLNSVDCGEVVYQFMYDNVPFFATAVSMLNKGVDAINGLVTGVSLSVSVSQNDFVKTVCDMLVKIYGMANAYIEVFTKGAFVLFKKIDAALERLENAIINLTEAIKNCILDVLNDIMAKIEKVLSLSIGIDWNSLIQLMRDCPCLTSVVAYLSGCQTDSDGNDISESPESVVACIRDKLDFLNPVNLIAGLRTMYAEYIKKYIDLVFGYLESWVVAVYNAHIKPLRALIKAYAKMLMAKVDFTWLVDLAGPFKCFLVYTDEYKNGKKYKGMSVIDIINSFKQWIPCFEHACPAFSEKIKNRSKEIYKDLRLDDKYWRNCYEIDLFALCIATKFDVDRPRDTVLRSLYNKTPLDVIFDFFTKSKRKHTAKPSTGLLDTPLSDDEVDAILSESSSKNTQSDLSQSIQFTNAPETENDVNSGPGSIDIKAENSIIAIIENLSAGGDGYYVEKLYQLVRLMNDYTTSQEYVDAAQRALDKAESLSGNYDTIPNSYLKYRDQRPNRVFDDTDKRVTYSIENDYDSELCDKMMSSDIFLMKRGSSESRVNFYSRMYNTAMA